MSVGTHGFVVVPAYNERAGLPRFASELFRVLAEIASDGTTAFTLVVVDDGSIDGTDEIVERLATEGHPGVAVRLVPLLRNFGHQAALVAGLLHAAPEADFVITMDADGEHPVELLPQLIDRWRDGEDLVHTARRPHRSLGPWKRLASSAYYRLLRSIGSLRISPGMADFKLWSGELLRQVGPALPTCGSTRAFAAWLAPDAPILTYDQRIAARPSRFTTRRMWSLALAGLVRYSELPLRLATLVGLSAFAFAGALTAFVLWAAATGRTIPGWSSLMIALSILSGLQSLSLGILGEYLLRNTFRSSLPSFVLKERRPRARFAGLQPEARSSASSSVSVGLLSRGR